MLNKLINALFHKRTAPHGRFVGRGRTRDVSFQYRMGAGFVGDVNRTHPASIEPALIDASAPPTAFGQPVVVDPTTQGVRPLAAGDSALTAIYGLTVRPWPTQQATAALNYAQAVIGASAPPTSGQIDVLRSGYIMVQTNVGSAPVKGGSVYIWVAATSGNHIQGQFESAPSAGNTIELDAKSSFNGTPDANGVVELAFNI